MMYAGVDGCRAGWVAAFLTPAREFGPLQIYPSFADLVIATADARLTLVDIPIGLADNRSLRTCDQLARERLGPRRSSIFAVPVRTAVHAATYADACAANYAATGKKISLQSWNICAKIAAADLVVREAPEVQTRLRESHPELCFAALNVRRPLLSGKKTAEGRAERLALLTRFAPNAAEALANARQRFARATAADDDLLDAMVLAVSALLADAAGVPALPQAPERDRFGLRMEIVLPIDWS